MAKTKSEKIAEIAEQILQLENQKKRLLQQQKEQERKDRTKRLCRRMGLLESMLPDTIPLTEEQFKVFLEKTVLTDFAQKTLTEITAQPIHSIPSNPIQTAHDSSAAREQDAGNSARVTD